MISNDDDLNNAYNRFMMKILINHNGSEVVQIMKIFMIIIVMIPITRSNIELIIIN